MAEPMSVEQRLGRIEARAEIGDLVARYALGADRRNDPAILGPLFTADATWSADGFGVLRGRDAIARGLAAIAAERVLWSIHYMVSPLIVLDAATGRGGCQWYLWELCSIRTGDGAQDQWLGGWYDSQVERTDDGWRFSSVTLDVRLQGAAMPAWALKKAAPR